MSPSPLRILLVDDHTLVRAGLRALIGGEPGLVVAGEAGNGEEAVRLAADLEADVVLMDLRLSDGRDGMDGAEATRRLVTALPGVRVVVLTSYGTRADVMRAMEAGARGYVLKAGPPEELFRAVRAAASGGVGLAPEIADRLISGPANPATRFSDREIQVLSLLAEGLTNRAIADSLFLTEATVKTHLVRLFRKLGTGSRAGAVSEAVRRGLVKLD